MVALQQECVLCVLYYVASWAACVHSVTCLLQVVFVRLQCAVGLEQMKHIDCACTLLSTSLHKLVHVLCGWLFATAVTV